MKPQLFALVAVGLVLTACSRDYASMRREHIDRFLGEDLDRSREVLARGGPLDLDGCVTLALDSSLAVRTADLQTRLSTIDRQAAFGAFLPRITITANHNGDFHGIEIGNPGQWAVMSDQSVTRGSVNLVQPLFIPQAWFMYALFREGEDIARLAAERVRQQVALGVAAAYYRCLADDDRLKQLRTDLEHVETVLKQVLALAREGLVTPAEREAWLAVAAGAQAGLAAAERTRDTGRVDLLQAMGLHPLAHLDLRSPSREIPPSTDPIEALILTALCRRPELGIADRGIVIRQHEAHLALAAWLPNLVLNGAITGSSDSHLRFQWNASLGVAAVMTVLQGFENVNAYRRARAEEEAACVRREQQVTAIVVEVLRAQRLVIDATAAGAVVAQARRAAEMAYAQIAARWHEGLITPGDRLEALTALQRVRQEQVLLDRQQQLALLTLADICGRSPWRSTYPMAGEE